MSSTLSLVVLVLGLGRYRVAVGVGRFGAVVVAGWRHLFTVRAGHGGRLDEGEGKGDGGVVVDEC